MTPGTKILTKADDAAEFRALALDLTQLCFDLAGIVDPTPISDGTSALISLGRGQWFDGVLSGLSMVPYVGDLAKAGKFPKYLKTVERAIVLAQNSPKAAELLKPAMGKLNELLTLFPDNLPGQLQELRTLVRRFLQENRAVKAATKRLPDISSQFKPKPRWREGAWEYEEISGSLGVPGKVVTHRDVNAQRAISSGTGEHAGHRIGVQFGAPGDASNMALQNANMNTFAPKTLQPAFQGNGASYLKMEQDWADKLQNGYGIQVRVRDKYRPGEERPLSREVEWTEISPLGARETKNLEFGNFSSPQQRNAAGN